MIYDSSILIAEILEFKNKLWRNNEFCSCGADSLKYCICDSVKKKRFLRRRKREVNERFSDELDEAFDLMAQAEEVK